ncbi:HTH-type transcriptional activator RhaS [Pararobbsia alpina]|uniref:HTH-type transcriptional activator RhaS n=2 Tax=Pararobbsia alpina TaxID=621374 RepID=A0A6S7CK66_9BURK|nr:HTH-type transcriptional activator RhaS [Pararobbsia alpina]
MSRSSTVNFGAPVQSGIVHSHFNVQAKAPQQPLLAWRDRVGHVIDVLPSLSDLEKPFRASIDRYGVGQLAFTDCRSDSMLLERSLTRISRDSIRDYAFHVFLEGDVDDVAVRASPRNRASGAASILVLDMGQPVRMRRNTCRVLTFFVPGILAQEMFPDPEALHGRTMQNETPLTGLIVEHVTALSQNIAGMGASVADSAIRTSAQLLLAAFGKQAGLSGNARAAARAAMFGRVRRYIQANLSNESLSPESVLNALQLPRPTLYRLFQHEGGLGAYIRHLRLRQAADELARYPHVTVTEIAYGLGFKSSSDFTRAFRRAYDMAPQDFRALSMEGGQVLPRVRHNEPAEISG